MVMSNNYSLVPDLIKAGGEGGIRTHGTRKGTTIFETARFNHSRTSPHEPMILANEGNSGKLGGRVVESRRASTTPSAEAASTPPVQEGSLRMGRLKALPRTFCFEEILNQ